MSLDDASCTRKDINTANKQHRNSVLPSVRVAEFSLARFYSIPQKRRRGGEREREKREERERRERGERERREREREREEEEEEEEEEPANNPKPQLLVINKVAFVLTQ